MIFIIYYICKYPNVKARFLQELDDVFGSDFGNCKITQNHLDQLYYLDAIIKEAARLTPVAAIIGRLASKEDEIAGYHWPAETFFFENIISINYHPLEWEDPETFNPDWFLKTNSDVKSL